MSHMPSHGTEIRAERALSLAQAFCGHSGVTDFEAWMSHSGSCTCCVYRTCFPEVSGVRASAHFELHRVVTAWPCPSAAPRRPCAMQSFVDRVRDRAEILHGDANQHRTMIAANLGRRVVQTCCSIGLYMEGVREIVSEPQTETAGVHAGLAQTAAHGHLRSRYTARPSAC